LVVNACVAGRRGHRLDHGGDIWSQHADGCGLWVRSSRAGAPRNSSAATAGSQKKTSTGIARQHITRRLTLLSVPRGSQIFSDISGICFGGTVEAICTKLGLPTAKLTSAQAAMGQTKRTTTLGAVCCVTGVPQELPITFSRLLSLPPFSPLFPERRMSLSYPTLCLFSELDICLLSSYAQMSVAIFALCRARYSPLVLSRCCLSGLLPRSFVFRLSFAHRPGRSNFARSEAQI